MHFNYYMICLLFSIDIAPEFTEQLSALVPLILEPGSLMEKEINGSKVTCRGLLEYFRVSSFLFITLFLVCGCFTIKQVQFLYSYYCSECHYLFHM